jgi:hypothetical protein
MEGLKASAEVDLRGHKPRAPLTMAESRSIAYYLSSCIAQQMVWACRSTRGTRGGQLCWVAVRE